MLHGFSEDRAESISVRVDRRFTAIDGSESFDLSMPNARVEVAVRVADPPARLSMANCQPCLPANTGQAQRRGIRNDAALRYEVPHAVWQSGLSISNG